MKQILFSFLCICPFFSLLQAQVRNMDKRIERKVNDRINRKVDQGIDKGLDEVEKTAEGKNKKNDPQKGKKVTDAPTATDVVNNTNQSKTFSAQSRFDFVAGDKIMAVEDFSQDATGDFPARWNTDASAEIMTIDGEEGKWLALTRSGALTPEFIKQLPENFTLEFDVYVSPTYSYYDASLGMAFAKTKSTNDFSIWKLYGDSKRAGHTGAIVWLHPQNAGAVKAGHSNVEVWEAGKKVMSNTAGNISSFNLVNNKTHVAIWRQNQRLRVYLGEEKIWDLPKAFAPGTLFNSLVFSRYNAKDDHNFFISNLRLAAGNPDTRHKLINEGRFSTSGIYFNTGSAQIKPESHGVIKEIASALKENPDVKIDIIGHTDNTGNAAANQKLSEQRAEAVKQYLNKTFGIDAGRITTSGKGSTQPLAGNTTSEGKAQNRRVEFVKK